MGKKYYSRYNHLFSSLCRLTCNPTDQCWACAAMVSTSVVCNMNRCTRDCICLSLDPEITSIKNINTIMTERKYIKIGVAGPVGSGKTALIERLSRQMNKEYS